MSDLEFAASEAHESGIPIHGAEGFAGMRKAGQLAAQALDVLVGHVRPGVTTAALDRIAFEFAMDHGAVPATLNYRGYKYSICTSVNHVVCHGMPNPKPLREGDIVNIDITLIVDGWHGDTSRMYNVGRINRKAERLIEVTHHSLQLGIEAIKPGRTTADIGAAIQEFAEAERYSVVEDFCGHGVGLAFHERPNILHYAVSRKKDRTEVLRPKGVPLMPGMIFTVEPMLNLGKPDVLVKSDGWTAVTRDKQLSAQFEHTVGVTEDGCEVFTYSPAGFHAPPYQGA